MNITEKDIINKLKEIEPECFNNFKFNYTILYEGKITKATPEFFASLALKAVDTQSSRHANNNNTTDDLIAQGMFFTYLYMLKGKMALDVMNFSEIPACDKVTEYYLYPKSLGSIKYSVNKIFPDSYVDPYNFTIYCELYDFNNEYSIVSIRYHESQVGLDNYSINYVEKFKKQKDFKVSEYFTDTVPDDFSVGLEKIGPTPLKPGDWCCLCAYSVSASHITENALSNAFSASNLVYASYGTKFKSPKDDLKDFKWASLEIKIFED